MAASSAAQKRWEQENEIQERDVDAIYRWDGETQRAIQEEKPWANDPNYFKR